MAQLNITLDQEEILALLSKNHDGAFRKLLQACLNKVLLAESAEQLDVPAPPVISAYRLSR